MTKSTLVTIFVIILAFGIFASFVYFEIAKYFKVPGITGFVTIAPLESCEQDRSCCEQTPLNGVCFRTDKNPSFDEPFQWKDLSTINNETTDQLHYHGSYWHFSNNDDLPAKCGFGRVGYGSYGWIFSGPNFDAGVIDRKSWTPTKYMERSHVFSPFSATCESEITSDRYFLVSKAFFRCDDKKNCTYPSSSIFFKVSNNNVAQGAAYRTDIDGSYCGFEEKFFMPATSYDEKLDKPFLFVIEPCPSHVEQTNRKIFYDLTYNQTLNVTIVLTTKDYESGISDWIDNYYSKEYSIRQEFENFTRAIKFPKDASNDEKGAYYLNFYSNWFDTYSEYQDAGNTNFKGKEVITPNFYGYYGMWKWDSFWSAFSILGVVDVNSNYKDLLLNKVRNWIQVWKRNTETNNVKWPQSIRQTSKPGIQTQGGWALAAWSLYKIDNNKSSLCDFEPNLKADYEAYKLDRKNNWLLHDASINLGRDGTDIFTGYDSIDATSWFLLNSIVMANIENECGNTALASQYLEDFKNIADDINKNLWDKDIDFYCSLDSKGKCHFYNDDIKSYSADPNVCWFVALNVSDSKQTTQVIDRLLTDFVDVAGLTSIPKTHACYSPSGADNSCDSGETWDGPTWAGVDNTICTWALRQQVNVYGRSDLQDELDYLNKLTLKVAQQNKFGAESYNSKGVGVGAWGSAPYGWGALVGTNPLTGFNPLSTLKFSFGGVPPNPDQINTSKPASKVTLFYPDNNAVLSGTSVIFGFNYTSTPSICSLYTDVNGIFGKTSTKEFGNEPIYFTLEQQFLSGTYKWSISCNDEQSKAIYGSENRTFKINEESFATSTYYLSNELVKNFDSSFSFYLGNDFEGNTGTSIKSMIETAKPKKVLAQAWSMLADSSQSCMVMKYNLKWLESKLNKDFFPIWDEIYDNNNFKPYIKGLVLGDETPSKWDVTFDQAYKYNGFFKSRFGYDMDKSLISNGNDIKSHHDIYEFIAEGCGEGFSNAYKLIKKRYPDWEIIHAPEMDYLLGDWWYERYRMVQIENMSMDGFLLEGTYRYYGTKEYNNQIYYFTKYARDMYPGRKVYTLIQNFNSNEEGIKNTTANAITYGVMHSYLAGADGVIFWSKDYTTGEPVYSSSDVTSKDRWNATISISNYLKDRDIIRKDNNILVVYPWYSVAADKDIDGNPPYRLTLYTINKLTQAGVTFDVLTSKDIINKPSKIDKYDVIFAFRQTYEPEALKTILIESGKNIVFDSDSFMKDELGSKSAVQFFEKVIGKKDDRSTKSINLIDFTNGTVKKLNNPYAITTTSDSLLSGSHQVYLKLNSNDVGILRHNNNFYVGFDSFRAFLNEQDFKDAFEYSIETIFEYYKINYAKEWDDSLIFYIDDINNSLIVMSYDYKDRDIILDLGNNLNYAQKYESNPSSELSIVSLKGKNYLSGTINGIVVMEESGGGVGSKPADVTPPKITFLGNDSTTNQSSVVKALTNENANLTVLWGYESSDLSSTATNMSYLKTTTVVLSKLKSNAAVYYKAISCDIAGNCANSDVKNFTTMAFWANINNTKEKETNDTKPAAKPTILKFGWSPPTLRTDIFWKTNASSDSKVEYGTTKSLGGEKYISKESDSHAIPLINLSQGATYYFKITSCNSAGCDSSELLNFTTVEINASKYDGITTDFSKLDFDNITEMVLEKRRFGKIEFKGHINITRAIDLDSYTNISSSKLFVDTSKIPELNVSAIITFYNLSLNNPRILRDGIPCLDSICKIINKTNSTITFNVTGFSEYTVEETPQADSSASASTTGSSGGSGGSSSSGGSSGGGGFSYVCNYEWQCANWSICSNNNQTRKCDFIKIAQHAQASECPIANSPPITVQACKEAKKQDVINFSVSVNVSIPNAYKKIKAGNILKAEISLTSFGANENIELNATYLFADAQNNSFCKENEIINLDKEMNFTKSFKIPADLKKGAYHIIVNVSYKTGSAQSISAFEVTGNLKSAWNKLTARATFIDKQTSKFGLKSLIIIAIILCSFMIMFFVSKRFERETEKPAPAGFSIDELELYKYVVKELNKGFAASRIKKVLLNIGWKSETVDKVINAALRR